MSIMTEPVLMHPEVTSDPRVLRWVLTGRSDSLAHAAAEPDSPLQRLVVHGTLRRATGGAGWIDTELGAGHEWRDIAAEVRDAVGECAAHAAPHAVSDADLRELAQEVLEREIAPLAGAHGGRIEIVGVEGHTVTVSLEGACHGCPAAKVTLQDRFQRSLARRIPDATVVEDSRSAARTTARPAGPLRLPFPRWRKG